MIGIMIKVVNFTDHNTVIETILLKTEAATKATIESTGLTVVLMITNYSYNNIATILLIQLITFEINMIISAQSQ